MGNYATVGKPLNFFQRWAARRKKAAAARELAMFRHECCYLSYRLRQKGYHVAADELDCILMKGE